MLRNPAYVGQRRYAGRDYPVLALVTPELFACVQKTNLDIRPRSDWNDPRRSASSNALSGLAYCADCGRLLWANSIHRTYRRRIHYRYYLCPNNSSGKCSLRLAAPKLESAV